MKINIREYTKMMVALAIVLIVVTLGSFYFGPTFKTKANVSSLSVIGLTDPQNPMFARSTTTKAFLTPASATATTTYIFYTANADSIGIDLALTASTSAATLGWQFAYTNDTNCSATATTLGSCNWFEDDAVVPPTTGIPNSNYDHASTTVTNRWNTGNATASTTYKHIEVPVRNAQYTLVRFFMTPGSVNGAIWTRAILKDVNTN